MIKLNDTISATSSQRVRMLEFVALQHPHDWGLTFSAIELTAVRTSDFCNSSQTRSSSVLKWTLVPFLMYPIVAYYRQNHNYDLDGRGFGLL
jgi:hypothetical protein